MGRSLKGWPLKNLQFLLNISGIDSKAILLLKVDIVQVVKRSLLTVWVNMNRWHSDVAWVMGLLLFNFKR